MKSYPILTLFLFLQYVINAQVSEDCDNKVINTYQNSIETAWESIKFTDGFTTVGNNGDLHAYIDPLAPCGNLSDLSELNYITTFIPIKDNETTQHPDPENIDFSIWQVNTEYFDGLARSIQTISSKVSPTGKDLVSFTKYNSAGIVTEEYLPFYLDLESVGSGSYRPNVVEEHQNFYDHYFDAGTTAKSEIDFDNSPLNRVLSQGSPGADWQLSSGNTVDFEYGHNYYTEVKKWSVSDNGELKSEADYHSNELYKIETNDENDHDYLEYTDLRGRTIMTKKMNQSGVWMETYYVYDDYDLLRYIIPPKASANLVVTLGSNNYSNNDVINHLCYYYEYDARKRLVEKKLPGAEPVYMIYDKHDKLVLTQDGKLRIFGSWLFTKYDARNRPVITGLYTNSSITDPASMQTELDDFYTDEDDPWEVYEAGSNAYTDNAFPKISISDCDIYSENYYDTYDYAESLGTNYEYSNYFNEDLGTNAFGLLTANKTKILDHSGLISEDYIYTVNWYDSYKRVIEIVSTNHKGGIDRKSNKYNFSGELLKSFQTHNISGNDADNIEILNEYEYDRMSRLLSIKETVNDDAVVTQENVYDEFGRLYEKKLHKIDSESYLQTISHTYNIKGWMEEMNSDYFFMDLKYNEGTNPLYNGNISGMDWSSHQFPELKSYSYIYDPTDRILSATDNNNYYSSAYSYDLNGNIKSLSRRAKVSNDPVSYDVIDNLEYVYASGDELSNKLYTIDDNTGTNYQTYGFTDNGNFDREEYFYDANGNLVLDFNKKITAISYNHLNLPEIISINTSKTNLLKYTYDAAGIKLQKMSVEGEKTTSTTDYCGRFVYDGDDKIIYILTDYGRITVSDDGSYTILRHYNITDHLGNTRITFNDQ
jgi:hypothetical protein